MKKFLCLIGLMFSLTAIAQNKLVITDYHQVFIPCHDQQGALMIAIRMYYVDTTPYFLLVDPYTFGTQTAPAAFCAPSEKTAEAIPHYHYHTIGVLRNTPYMRALKRYTEPLYRLQDYGINHAESPVAGLFLTADMCPSRKMFETNFFNTLIAFADKNQQPVPIALAVSGLWILGHEKEFAWLLQQQKANKLKITWVNHSFSHLYFKDLSLRDNFVLFPYTNFTSEVLDTEKILLENHQLPSVFFRFPGLVSNKERILELRQFGLIPIGSDAWLAYGQTPRAGSIILVHGNGNEPEGIAKVIPFLKQTDLPLLPLSDAFFKKSNGGNEGSSTMVKKILRSMDRLFSEW